MKKKMALVLVMIVAIVSTGCIKNEKNIKLNYRIFHLKIEDFHYGMY